MISPWIRWFWCSLATVLPGRGLVKGASFFYSSQVQEMFHTSIKQGFWSTAHQLAWQFSRAVSHQLQQCPDPLPPWQFSLPTAALSVGAAPGPPCRGWDMPPRSEVTKCNVMIILFPKWFFSCLLAFQQSPRLSFVAIARQLDIQVGVSVQSTLRLPFSLPSQIQVKGYLQMEHHLAVYPLRPVFLRKSLLHHRFLTKKGCSIESSFSTLLQWMKTVAKKNETQHVPVWKGSDQKCPFLNVILIEELLIIDKELPAEPGSVIEGEDDWYRGRDQQYVIGCWVQHVVSPKVRFLLSKGLNDALPLWIWYIWKRDSISSATSQVLSIRWPEKGNCQCQLKPENTGQKKQENCVYSLLPFCNFCGVLVKRVRVSRFNTLQNLRLKQQNSMEIFLWNIKK